MRHKNIREKQKGWGCPLSFHLFIFHTSDGSVWWRSRLLWDFSLFSAIRARDKRRTSKWNFLIQILLRRPLLCDFLLSSPRRFPGPCPRLRRWSDLALGNEISRDSVHRTMPSMTFVSVFVSVLQHFYSMQVRVYTLAHTRMHRWLLFKVHLTQTLNTLY